MKKFSQNLPRTLRASEQLRWCFQALVKTQNMTANAERERFTFVCGFICPFQKNLRQGTRLQQQTYNNYHQTSSMNQQSNKPNRCNSRHIRLTNIGSKCQQTAFQSPSQPLTRDMHCNTDQSDERTVFTCL